MIRVEHIGIAMDHLDEVNDLYQKLFNKPHYKEEEVVSESVKTSFFQVGETKIEFLESSKADGPIGKFIEKRGAGLHHIAFEVADIQEEMKRLEGEGFRFINEAPKEGADNKLVAFIHPKSTKGVLVELCQERR
ncbi:MAG: methylmalonyl-CoA epimerase [Bacteroidota bacterium]